MRHRNSLRFRRDYKGNTSKLIRRIHNTPIKKLSLDSRYSAGYDAKNIDGRGDMARADIFRLGRSADNGDLHEEQLNNGFKADLEQIFKKFNETTLLVTEHSTPPPNTEVRKTLYVCSELSCPWHMQINGAPYYEVLRAFAEHNRKKHQSSSEVHLRYGHDIIGLVSQTPPEQKTRRRWKRFQ